METIQDQIRKAEAVIIYGAHLTALECGRWLIQTEAGDKLSGFAVTDMDGNPERLMGFPVRNLKDYREQSRSALIILAMPEKYHMAAKCYAGNLKFYNFLALGLERMSELKGSLMIERQKEFGPLPFVLKKNHDDPTWMDMFDPENEFIRHYKFPALFYLEEEKWIEAAASLDFYGDYERVCGCYRNIHMLPIDGESQKHKPEIRKILKIFMAFSSWDSKTAETVQHKPWIYPIQVGSTLSGRGKGDLFDDSGDHISQYNGLFAEMTGAYWIWKNESLSKYKGLCHYRRHFIISEKEILKLEDNRIDVVLPTPRYVPGGLKGMFLAETPVKSKVFESMLCAVSELYADEKKEFETYLDSCFYYPNNMVIAKKDIYDNYCSWVFPVLFRMQQIDVESNYGHEDDRHIAYAAELLTSFYFVKNRDQYCIAVTDYKFML